MSCRFVLETVSTGHTKNTKRGLLAQKNHISPILRGFIMWNASVRLNFPYILPLNRHRGPSQRQNPKIDTCHVPEQIPDPELFKVSLRQSVFQAPSLNSLFYQCLLLWQLHFHIVSPMLLASLLNHWLETILWNKYNSL